ncbi:MAG: hypothetical protein KatS3mg131_1102 [Candidatus Tectimicrobiota bacterium]|nr:MAG: hypothetical protein KatS3mg131_1102 [Candidatus Tectomicrobia bacterium]
MRLTITTRLFGLPGGQQQWQTQVVLPAPTVTVRELIACKIRQEVADYAAGRRPALSGEYLPPEALLRAVAAGGYRPGAVEEEVARAQDAFARRAFMVVVDERRVDDADARLTLSPASRVEFIKILPLVGG